MQGHVARKGNRWYAVVYDGVDPQTGRERRGWHPAGTDRAEAERLADELATAAARRRSERERHRLARFRIASSRGFLGLAIPARPTRFRASPRLM